MIGIATAALALRDVFEIRFRADLELRVLGEIGQRLGVAFRPLIEIVLQLVAILPHLLLKERMKDDAPMRRRLPFV